MCRYTLILLLCVCSAALCHADSQNSAAGVQHRLSGQTMGTQWQATWLNSTPGKAHDTTIIEQALTLELERINALMSTWDPASELSRFNASTSERPVRLHPDTLLNIDTAIAISRQTQGAYDITLAPVIRLWGFAQSGPTINPDEQSLKKAMQAVGHQRLVRDGSTVQKTNAGIAIDLSSLAKGFAVDQLGLVLEAHDITHYMVDIGGEIRTRVPAQASRIWRIGIENPDGEANRGLGLRNAHIASSGTYRNYRIENGQRVSHIIDGRTGRPITHNLVAVSVMHDSTMLADAWATALLVVGAAHARKLIDEHQLAAQLTLAVENAVGNEVGNSFAVEQTESFKALLLHE